MMLKLVAAMALAAALVGVALGVLALIFWSKGLFLLLMLFGVLTYNIHDFLFGKY
jgi:hypothetical protein